MNARRWGWLLGFTTAVAAAAAIFGPTERFAGVDVGATGASLFTLSVGAGMWLLAKRGDDVFAEHMSIAERRAWIGVVFLTIILASFTAGVIALASHGQPPARLSDLQARFPMRLGILIVLWLFSASLLARHGALDADERDLQLQHRADRAANLALKLIVIGAIVVLVFVPRDALGWWLAPLVLAHCLLGLLLVRSLVEHLALAVSYRRA